MSKTSVFCIANSFPPAERIIDRLQLSGFPREEISIVYPGDAGNHDVGHIKTTKAPEGVATGVTSGGVVGGTLGLLAGIGLLAVPGVGPFLAAGPIMAALSGAALGATAGGVVGGLIGLGIPEIEARIYETKLRGGNYLIAVHTRTKDEEDYAMAIFNGENAEHVCIISQDKVP